MWYNGCVSWSSVPRTARITSHTDVEWGSHNPLKIEHSRRCSRCFSPPYFVRRLKPVRKTTGAFDPFMRSLMQRASSLPRCP